MSWNDQADSRSCVLLRLGERRFALAADQVAELVPPSRIFRFPHRTPEIDGVILRRGRTVPVCDLAETTHWKKTDVATLLLDCDALVRCRERDGGLARERRMRTDPCGPDASRAERFSPCRCMAFS